MHNAKRIKPIQKEEERLLGIVAMPCLWLLPVKFLDDSRRIKNVREEEDVMVGRGCKYISSVWIVDQVSTSGQIINEPRVSEREKPPNIYHQK